MNMSETSNPLALQFPDPLSPSSSQKLVDSGCELEHKKANQVADVTCTSDKSFDNYGDETTSIQSSLIASANGRSSLDSSAKGPIPRSQPVRLVTQGGKPAAENITPASPGGWTTLSLPSPLSLPHATCPPAGLPHGGDSPGRRSGTTAGLEDALLGDSLDTLRLAPRDSRQGFHLSPAQWKTVLESRGFVGNKLDSWVQAQRLADLANQLDPQSASSVDLNMGLASGDSGSEVSPSDSASQAPSNMRYYQHGSFEQGPRDLARGRSGRGPASNLESEGRDQGQDQDQDQGQDQTNGLDPRFAQLLTRTRIQRTIEVIRTAESELDRPSPDKPSPPVLLGGPPSETSQHEDIDEAGDLSASYLPEQEVSTTSQAQLSSSPPEPAKRTLASENLPITSNSALPAPPMPSTLKEMFGQPRRPAITRTTNPPIAASCSVNPSGLAPRAASVVQRRHTAAPVAAQIFGVETVARELYTNNKGSLEKNRPPKQAWSLLRVLVVVPLMVAVMGVGWMQVRNRLEAEGELMASELVKHTKLWTTAAAPSQRPELVQSANFVEPAPVGIQQQPIPSRTPAAPEDPLNEPPHRESQQPETSHQVLVHKDPIRSFYFLCLWLAASACLAYFRLRWLFASRNESKAKTSKAKMLATELAELVTLHISPATAKQFLAAWSEAAQNHPTDAAVMALGPLEALDKVELELRRRIQAGGLEEHGAGKLERGCLAYVLTRRGKGAEASRAWHRFSEAPGPAARNELQKRIEVLEELRLHCTATQEWEVGQNSNVRAQGRVKDNDETVVSENRGSPRMSKIKAEETSPRRSPRVATVAAAKQGCCSPAPAFPGSDADHSEPSSQSSASTVDSAAKHEDGEETGLDTEVDAWSEPSEVTVVAPKQSRRTAAATRKRSPLPAKPKKNKKGSADESESEEHVRLSAQSKQDRVISALGSKTYSSGAQTSCQGALKTAETTTKGPGRTTQAKADDSPRVSPSRSARGRKLGSTLTATTKIETMAGVGSPGDARSSPRTRAVAAREAATKALSRGSC